MTGWFRNWWSFTGQERTAGFPQSGNGASSCHLWWDVRGGERYTSASVTVEMTKRPDLDRLVFCALQVSFAEPAGGGAHLGLQHNPRFPHASAANWGGYAPRGGLLKGSASLLPSTPNDVNTRDFPWLARVPYRLTVARGEQLADGSYAWQGSITDLSVGRETVVRSLYSPGKYLRAPVVWMESFARCDDAACEIRWSDASLVSASGDVYEVTAMRAAYQAYASGGCTNTNTVGEGSSFVQTTNSPRVTKEGTQLSID